MGVATIRVEFIHPALMGMVSVPTRLVVTTIAVLLGISLETVLVWIPAAIPAIVGAAAIPAAPMQPALVGRVSVNTRRVTEVAVPLDILPVVAVIAALQDLAVVMVLVSILLVIRITAEVVATFAMQRMPPARVEAASVPI